MSQDYSRGTFDGARWFDQQVRTRTRAALNDRGSHASSRSAEYRKEYQLQLLLFRAERAAVKRRRAEINAERLKKKADSEARPAL